MLKLGVLVSGGGTNLQAIIDAIEAGDLNAKITVVLSDNPEAYGLKRASAHGIPTEVVTRDGYPTKKTYDTRAVELLRSHGVEYVVLAGFMRIISKVFLAAFPMRIINIHPSLLPSFPGLDVQQAAIEHGVRFSGCTVHFVDEGIDSGPIIIQAVVPVLDGDTEDLLSARILKEEHRIYPQAIQFISEGRVRVHGRRVHIKGPGASESDHIVNPPITLTEG